MQVGKKEKDVSVIKIILFQQLLLLSEACPIFLPSFKVLEETKKPNLLQLCREDPILKRYIPDKTDLSELDRNFLLMVRLIFYVS